MRRVRKRAFPRPPPEGANSCGGAFSRGDISRALIPSPPPPEERFDMEPPPA